MSGSHSLISNNRRLQLSAFILLSLLNLAAFASSVCLFYYRYQLTMKINPETRLLKVCKHKNVLVGFYVCMFYIWCEQWRQPSLNRCVVMLMFPANLHGLVPALLLFPRFYRRGLLRFLCRRMMNLYSRNAAGCCCHNLVLTKRNSEKCETERPRLLCIQGSFPETFLFLLFQVVQIKQSGVEMENGSNYIS